MLEENPLAWMIEVKSLLVDALVMSQEVRAEAYRLGLVPMYRGKP